MQFRFTRDEEGTERIHVGEVCVARMSPGDDRSRYTAMQHVAGVTDVHILDAIERADGAGYWNVDDAGVYAYWEALVDVPVPETTATLTLVSDGEDQS